MSEIEESLRAAIESPDTSADQLSQLVYDDLRRLAEQRLRNEPVGQTLQATALVHEAYVRLLGPENRGAGGWDGRGHFFAAAAEAMRRILVDRARARSTHKRGGGRQRLPLDLADLAMNDVPSELIDLDEALQRFAAEAPVKAELVKLRFFGGLTLPQAARVLDISETTADRYWAYAKAWLLAAMDGEL